MKFCTPDCCIPPRRRRRSCCCRRRHISLIKNMPTRSDMISLPSALNKIRQVRSKHEQTCSVPRRSDMFIVQSVIVVVTIQFNKGILQSVKWLVKLSGAGDGRGSPRLVQFHTVHKIKMSCSKIIIFLKFRTEARIFFQIFQKQHQIYNFSGSI